MKRSSYMEQINNASKLRSEKDNRLVGVGDPSSIANANSQVPNTRIRAEPMQPNQPTAVIIAFLSRDLMRLSLSLLLFDAA